MQGGVVCPGRRDGSHVISQRIPSSSFVVAPGMAADDADRHGYRPRRPRLRRRRVGRHHSHIHCVILLNFQPSPPLKTLIFPLVAAAVSAVAAFASSAGGSKTPPFPRRQDCCCRRFLLRYLRSFGRKPYLLSTVCW